MHGAALCAMIAMSFFFVSCDDELDIVPKGKVTLSTLDEVELLLNQEYSINDFVANSLCLLTGESLGAFDNDCCPLKLRPSRMRICMHM